MCLALVFDPSSTSAVPAGGLGLCLLRPLLHTLLKAPHSPHVSVQLLISPCPAMSVSTAFMHGKS